ncbi:MAG: hypothetical protein JWP75_178 [Frondihabitans sp.]|nr:hypothetical protein [Frondihabitans sp.]
MTAFDSDVIVIGLGIHGTSTAYELARRGVSVIALEQFEKGHTSGSSHGATRMIRHAYPDPVWNPLVEGAFDGWRRWADDAGDDFVTTTGGLFAADGAGRLQGPGCVAVEPNQLASHFPSLRLPGDHFGVFDPSAGVVAAARALEYASERAATFGASLSYGESLTSWARDGEGIVVETSHRTVRAKRLVLAAGPWTAKQVPELASAFEVWRIVTLATQPGQPSATPPLLGTFSLDRPEGLVFGIPETPDQGFKIGIDAGPVWDPDVPNPPPTPDEIRVLDELMTSLVPGIDTRGATATACLYTMTADRRFVVGALPHDDRVIVAAACSGHGFKFGPAIGEAAADLALGVDRHDLDFLSPARPLAAS